MSREGKTYKQQAKEFIQQLISSGEFPPGAKLISQREVAKRLGISQKVATVAFLELEREGVLVRRHGSGSYVADGAPAPEEATGDLVYVVLDSLDNLQHLEFAHELEHQLQRHAKRLRILSPRSYASCREMLESIDRRELFGIVDLRGVLQLRGYAERFHIPYVQMLYRAPHRRKHFGSQLLLDVCQQATILSQHLLKLGYRRFLFAGSYPRFGENLPEPSKMPLRFEAIRRGVEAVGGSWEFIDEPLHTTPFVDYQETGMQLAKSIVQRLDDSSDATVAVFFNTARALGAMRAFRQAGIAIPQQLGVASFDNVYMARVFDPELTVVDAGYLTAARRSVELLLQQTPPLLERLDPMLRPGASTCSWRTGAKKANQLQPA